MNIEEDDYYNDQDGAVSHDGPAEDGHETGAGGDSSDNAADERQVIHDGDNVYDNSLGQHKSFHISAKLRKTQDFRN